MMVRSSYGCKLALFISIIFFFFFISYTKSSYLPGVSPGDYYTGEPLLQVKVNKLSSTKTQLPYDYYYLNYCKPNELHDALRDLGEVLRGDQIQSSVYRFSMREELACKVGCRIRLDAESANNFKEMIDAEYRVDMLLDDLPVADLRQSRSGSPSASFVDSFLVGFKGTYAGTNDVKYFINNHLSFRVMYHKDHETGSAQVVGFEVVPNSITHEYEELDEKNRPLTTCNQNTQNKDLGSTVPQEVDTNKEIVFTYDVTFKESEIKWASRWDAYILANDGQLPWSSIIYSLMIVLFVSGMVSMIMMRTLYKDILSYNQLDTQYEVQEEKGWIVVPFKRKRGLSFSYQPKQKRLATDVCQPPVNSGLLCLFVGTGVQIFGMTLTTMIIALLVFFLSPTNHNGLMTALYFLWVFMGLFAGYSSARLYKSLKGTEWKKNTLKASFMFPVTWDSRNLLRKIL